MHPTQRTELLLRFHFNKYALPYSFLSDSLTTPDELRPSTIFMPDEVLGAMDRAVKPLISPFERAYSEDLAKGKLAPLLPDSPGGVTLIVPGIQISWSDSVAMVRKTIEQISPEMAARFDNALSKGWIEHNATPAGLSAGDCTRGEDHDRPATVRFSHDGSISDPVYLAHELGHFLAYEANRGPPWSGRMPRALRISLEIQAFFFQHAFYSPDVNQDRSPDIAEAIALHRRAETLSIVRCLRKDFATFEEVRRGGSPRPDDYLDRGYALHKDEHSAAFFLGEALWRCFKPMNATQKTAFVNALYPKEDCHPESFGIPPLEKILSLVNISLEEDLRTVIAISAKELLAFTPAPTGSKGAYMACIV